MQGRHNNTKLRKRCSIFFNRSHQSMFTVTSVLLTAKGGSEVKSGLLYWHVELSSHMSVVI